MSLKDSLEIIARDIDVLDGRVNALESIEQVFTIYAGEVVINEAGVDVDLRVEGNTWPSLLFVDAGNDRIGVGTATPRWDLNFVNYGGGNLVLSGDVYQNNATSRSLFVLARARGTEAVPLPTQNGDNLGEFFWQGHDGTNFGAGCKITGWATENYTAAAKGARLRFYTTNNGTVGLVEQLRIDEDGGIFAYNLLGAAATTDINLDGANELHRVVSSKRYKKSIKKLSARFDSSLIYDLEPASFEWRKNTANPDMVDFGLIAEDVYEIFPSLVNLDNEGRPDSIRYTMLPVLLLAEIQKLNERVKELEDGN